MKSGGSCTIKVVIDRNTAYMLQAMKAQSGLSVSEQVRRAIRSWLGSRGWTIGRGKRHAKNIHGGD